MSAQRDARRNRLVREVQAMAVALAHPDFDGLNEQELDTLELSLAEVSFIGAQARAERGQP